MLRLDKTYSLEEIKLVRNYDKPGYANITENERDALKELAMNEGILLDPVYSGRAFYGMIDFLKNRRIPLNSNILFWHTGGLPATFEYASELKT